ncbi:MAG: radical SAM protein [Candidatus Helarchaeota archaeon]|nr:radical SAM protein [Candidatus Helarchaeota archaeon]
MKYVQPVYRPPSEAYSLLIQATIGCSRASCTFCASWLFNKKKIKEFAIRPIEEIEADLTEARKIHGENVKKIFFLDSNAIIMKTEDLRDLCEFTYSIFPHLERIGVYGCAKDILEKSIDELKLLKKAGLGIIYMGLESGDDETLKFVHKGVTSAEQIKAGQMIMQSEIPLSVTIILGLGGKKRWCEHAKLTGSACSQINPTYLGALTLMLVPGTLLHQQAQGGEFELLTPHDILGEMKLLVENLDLNGCIFRSNHASNYLAIGGVLSQEKKKVLQTIQLGLDQKIGLRPDFLRGL